jgi:hypothetical protein
MDKQGKVRKKEQALSMKYKGRIISRKGQVCTSSSDRNLVESFGHDLLSLEALLVSIG